MSTISIYHQYNIYKIWYVLIVSYSSSSMDQTRRSKSSTYRTCQLLCSNLMNSLLPCQQPFFLSQPLSYPSSRSSSSSNLHVRRPASVLQLHRKLGTPSLSLGDDDGDEICGWRSIQVPFFWNPFLLFLLVLSMVLLEIPLKTTGGIFIQRCSVLPEVNIKRRGVSHSLFPYVFSYQIQKYIYVHMSIDLV